jgi:uncharacterized protein YcaQ
MLTSLSLAEARRLVLAAQGFDRKRPRRATLRHLRDTVRRLGLLQIDCVNVVCPAHYMVRGDLKRCWKSAPATRLGCWKK